VKATAQTTAGQQASHSITVSVGGTPTPAAIALRPFAQTARYGGGMMHRDRFGA